MAKYIVTDKNIKYDNSYGNIPYFASEADRDTYVETYLLTNWKEKLKALPEKGKKIDTPLSDTINIAGDFSIMNKNYIIIEKKGKYYFYFITGIINNNNQNFDISIEKDLIMTYPGLLDKVNNIKLTQTHLPNYYGYNMDGGSKEVISVTDFPYKVNDNEVINQIRNKGWLVVFERVNDEDKYIPKIIGGNEYIEPYKIYIAPLTPLEVSEGEVDEDILYFQNDPNKFPMDQSTEITTILLGLSKEIDQSLSLNVYYTLTNGSNKDFPMSFSLTDYDLESEQFILLPMNGDKNTAISITKEIKEKGVYNERIYLNSALYVDYMPLKVLYNGTNFEVQFVTIDEFLVYLPNAAKEISTTEYWTDYSYGSEIGYGGYYGLIMNTPQFMSFNKISQSTNGLWSSDKLFNFLEDPDENANVITAKTTNFMPIYTQQNSGIFSILQSNNVLYDEDKEVYYLTSLNYDRLLDINTYSLDTSDMTKYDLIEGMNKYSLAIENLKEFSLNPNYITPNNTIEFKHYASFTPDWEERFKYINGNYISLTNEENALINSKEFIKGTDILAQYKVNNPVTSKLEWFKPFTSAGNIATSLLSNNKKISIQKSKNYIENLDAAFTKYALETALNGNTSTRGISQSINKNLNRKVESRSYGKTLTSVLPIIGDVASIGINRANMKRQPDEFTGNGDINGDLIFNENGIKFSLLEYGFLTPERDSMVEDIKRYGIATSIYIDGFKDPSVKEKSFNYYNVVELDNSDTNELIQLLSDEEWGRFGSILENGVRIWWDISKWKDFDSND